MSNTMSTNCREVHLDSEQFEQWREEGRLRTDRAYVISTHSNGHYWSEPTVQYAWSPDGVGCFWYETMHELVYEHGTEEDWVRYGCTPAGYEEWQVTLEKRRA